jgi:hypothetical protein
MADLAVSTPHSACACGGGVMYGRVPQPAAAPVEAPAESG